jgi:poly-beta-1,6-N-acetyl-D-glucosamine synthase
MLIFSVLVLFLDSQVVPLVGYYFWMRRKSKLAWGLILNDNYKPKVTLIVATYNEAVSINERLRNAQEIDYPPDKLQIIIIDSASSDGTVERCRRFLETNRMKFPIRLISESERLGKSHALNAALKFADGEIIATSDADSLWEPDALAKAVSYFADPTVGAVSGREELSNLNKSVYTQSEGLYRQFYYTLRLGESKVHSTLVFQGELALYRRSLLEKFEDRPGYSDDTGTVINMISKGHRCIFVPSAVFHDMAAHSLSGRLTVKSRRAEHLIAGVIESFRSRVRRQIPLPFAIVFFNLYMHVLSPLIFIGALYMLAVFFILDPLIGLFAVIAVCLFSCLRKPRLLMTSYLTSNIALVIGLFRHFFGKKQLSWRKIDEMREG